MVARLLAEAAPLSVHRHTDDFWHFIRHGWIAPYLPQAHRQNEVVIGVVGDAAFGYAAWGYQVFCDGIIGPWFLGPFRAAAPSAACRSTMSSCARTTPRPCAGRPGGPAGR